MQNDAQQRSWSIYDDAGIIQEYLEEFISIVEDADIRAVTNMIATFQSPGQLGSYEIVETLVVYYQMASLPAPAPPCPVLPIPRRLVLTYYHQYLWCHVPTHHHRRPHLPPTDCPCTMYRL